VQLECVMYERIAFFLKPEVRKCDKRKRLRKNEKILRRISAVA
jgi:hypothetical protein